MRWIKRKDGTHFLLDGRWKALEIFKRPGKFYCCVVWNKGEVVASQGYFTSCLPKRYHAVRWGVKKLRELNLMK